MKYIVTLRDRTYEVEVERGQAMILDEYEAKAPAAPVACVPAAAVAPVAQPAVTSPAGPAAPAPMSGTPVPAPLPGNIMSIDVVQGAVVKAGDLICVIEAMKMQNEVLAPQDGVVAQIAVSKGQLVATGDTLVII